MHEFAVLNREIVPADESFVSAASSAALYGKGVFTTVAIYDAKPFLWEKHWDRLIADTEKIGIDLSVFSEVSVKKLLLEIIDENNLNDGRARLTFFDETASRIWQAESRSATSFTIQTAEFRAPSDYFRLAVSPFPVNSKSPLAGVKSCNYLENILALERAKKDGFDEAVRVNERGEIASAAMANLFWTKNEKIFTPALETGCLAGTTRSFACENFPVAQVIIDLAELNEADEIFLASAGIGIVQASEFQEKKLRREPHELTKAINFKRLKAKNK